MRSALIINVRTADRHHGARLSLPVVLITCLAILTGANAVSAGAAGSACVPVSDPVYDFLEACVARGILPLWSINMRPLSRARIGDLLQLVIMDYPKLADKVLEAELDYYLREFAGDIINRSDRSGSDARTLRLVRYDPVKALHDPHWHAVVFRRDGFDFTLDPLIRFRVDADRDQSIFRRATGIQFRAVYDGGIGCYFRFVDHVERGNGPYLSRADLLEDRYGYVGPLQGARETYYDMTEAYLATELSNFEFAFGKDRLSWGPARGNDLLLSGTAPSFNQLRIGFRPFDKVRFGYVLGCLQAWNAPTDTLYQTDRGWTRISRPKKWIAAHRVEYMPWGWISLSVNESVIWGDRGLDWSYINPINFYFSAEHDGDDQDNVLLSGDCIVRIGRSGLLYGELLIDDMKLSTLGEGDPGNKFGVVIGAKLLDTGLDGLTSGIEYARLDPYVYTHFYPVNRYSNWTSSLGSDLAANSDRLRCRLRYRPRRNVELRVEIDRHRRGTVGADPYDSVERNHKGSVRFLDGNPESWISAGSRFSWEPAVGVVLGAGWISNDRRSFVRDRFYLEAGYRY